MAVSQKPSVQVFCGFPDEGGKVVGFLAGARIGELVIRLDAEGECEGECGQEQQGQGEIGEGVPEDRPDPAALIQTGKQIPSEPAD